MFRRRPWLLDGHALLMLVACVGIASSFTARHVPRYGTSRTIQTRRKAHLLNTSYERLALERAMENEGTSIAWLNPVNFESSNGAHDSDSVMPIYPLGASYLPSDVIHTLNNVEPRNIKMAEDLMDENKWKDACFCAVLCTADTGRIASVGSVMRIESVDPHYNPKDGSVSRIVVKCRAEQLVDILAIENPQAASRENRLQRSSEYLIAKVRPRQEKPVDLDDENVARTVRQILADYHAVRSMYFEGGGASELPPFAKDHLVGALPEWDENDLISSFWSAAQVWQTLCYTVREGRQMNLVADVNEVMIAAACEKGGPLKLPIHMGDLSPEARKKVEEMEMDAQREFVSLGLDPCLDFQALMSVNGGLKRLKFLSRLISRERKRLEALPSTPNRPSENDNEDKEPPKGAWFEGFE